MVSLVLTHSLSPPLPLSWGSLVWDLLLGAQLLSQPLMVAPSPALSMRAHHQGSSLLCRACLRHSLHTPQKCLLARWLWCGGRVLKPGGSLAGGPLGGEVFQA